MKLKIITICFLIILLLTGGSIYKKSELVTNGGFDTGDGWGTSNVIIADGDAACKIVGYPAVMLQEPLDIDTGKTYQARYDLTDYASGAVAVSLSVGGANITTLFAQKTAEGRYKVVFEADYDFDRITFTFAPTSNITIDNVSIKEIKKKVRTKKE